MTIASFADGRTLRVRVAPGELELSIETQEDFETAIELLQNERRSLVVWFLMTNSKKFLQFRPDEGPSRAMTLFEQCLQH